MSYFWRRSQQESSINKNDAWQNSGVQLEKEIFALDLHLCLLQWCAFVLHEENDLCLVTENDLALLTQNDVDLMTEKNHGVVAEKDLGIVAKNILEVTVFNLIEESDLIVEEESDIAKFKENEITLSIDVDRILRDKRKRWKIFVKASGLSNSKFIKSKNDFNVTKPANTTTLLSKISVCVLCLQARPK